MIAKCEIYFFIIEEIIIYFMNMSTKALNNTPVKAPSSNVTVKAPSNVPVKAPSNGPVKATSSNVPVKGPSNGPVKAGPCSNLSCSNPPWHDSCPSKKPFVEYYFSTTKNKRLEKIFNHFVDSYVIYCEMHAPHPMFSSMNKLKEFNSVEYEHFLFVKTDMPINHFDHYFWIHLMNQYHTIFLKERTDINLSFYDVILLCMILGGWIFPNFYEELETTPLAISVILMNFFIVIKENDTHFFVLKNSLVDDFFILLRKTIFQLTELTELFNFMKKAFLQRKDVLKIIFYIISHPEKHKSIKNEITHLKNSFLTEKLTITQFFMTHEEHLREVVSYFQENEKLKDKVNETCPFQKGDKLMEAYCHYIYNTEILQDDKSSQVEFFNKLKFSTVRYMNTIQMSLERNLPYFDFENYSDVPLKTTDSIEKYNTNYFFFREGKATQELYTLIDFIQTDEYFFNFMFRNETCNIIPFPKYVKLLNLGEGAPSAP